MDMKHVTFVMCWSLLLVLGCSRSKEDKDTTTGERESALLAAAKKTSATNAGAGSATKDFHDIGLRLNESLGFLRLGLPDKGIIAEIGELDRKSKAEEWGADGSIHQSWHYDSAGIELDLIEDKKEQHINMIKARSPCRYRTKKGIGIGSTTREVEVAYGGIINKDESSATSIVVGSVYGGMIFGIEKGIVTSIFIGAGAE